MTRVDGGGTLWERILKNGSPCFRLHVFWQMGVPFAEVVNAEKEQKEVGKKLSVVLLRVCGISKWKCPGSGSEAQE